IIFGAPRLGTSLVLGIEGFALFSLYYIGYNLDSFLIGFALAMGYLSIALGQFLLGWISDGKYTKLGRRKPYLIIFGPLLGISFIFLLLPALVLPDMNDQNSLFLWLLIWDIVFRFCYAVTTPYQAWMAEVFPASERPEVSQVQNTFNFIGNGLMAVTTLLVFTDVFDKVAANPNVIPIEFLIIVLAFGIIAISLFIVIVLVMPTEQKYEIKSNLWENLKNTVKNKNYMKVVFMQGLSGFGWSIISTVMLTYTETVLALSGTDYLIVAVCFLLSIFVFLYFWRKRIEKAGKKQTLLLIFLIAVFFLPITLLGLVEAIPALVLGIIFIIGVGLILGGWYLFPYIIYADLAEDDEKETGDLKAGVYTGFPSIILNIFQAIGVFLLGVILELRNIYVRSNFFSFGLVIWGPICSLILLIAYLFTRWYVNLDFSWEK
ncbi:MAG: MFS transporter, partial [Candidatus Hermodarchaeota archaeon]